MFFMLILDWIVIEPILIRDFGNFTHEYNIYLQLYLMLNPQNTNRLYSLNKTILVKTFIN